MDTNQNENELIEVTIYTPDLIRNAEDLNYNHIYSSVEECLSDYQILGLDKMYKYNIWIVKSEVIQLPKDSSCG